MSEHRVNPELLHRTAWGNPVWNALQSLNIYGFCLVASLVASFIWPLALPACLLFTLITMLVFSLQRWRCPLRMPMTLECADPSQDRMIKRSLFSFWPTCSSMRSFWNHRPAAYSMLVINASGILAGSYG